MNKHAYLIIAHSQFDFLKLLLKNLDYELHDIYLMIDKKVKIDKSIFKNLNKKSNLYIVPSVSINWGGYSQIYAELTLLKHAVKRGYSYYHLISGTDFPLKRNEEIYKFFEDSNKKEFIEVCRPINKKIINERYSKYYFLQDYNNKMLSRINKFMVFIQKKLHLNRNKNENFFKGANWFSITDDFARYVLSHEKKINHLFKYTFCCDEVFMQTLLMNSSFKKNLVNQETDFPNKRYTVWDQTHVSSPKILVLNDFKNIITSNCLFARKFDEIMSKELVDIIIENRKEHFYEK